MKRVIAFLLLAIPFVILVALIFNVRSHRNPDAVLATFVCPEAPTTRMVFFNSGKYELHPVKDGVPNRPYKRTMDYHFRSGRVEATTRRHPFETGTYLSSSTNCVVTVESNDPSSPGGHKRAYRIVVHDGREYMFDERGTWAQKYEETKDTNVLHHAWWQERG